jgi:hypothetical protein
MIHRLQRLFPKNRHRERSEAKRSSIGNPMKDWIAAPAFAGSQ